MNLHEHRAPQLEQTMEEHGGQQPQGLDLGALASPPLGTPLRSAASPHPSPLQGFWVAAPSACGGLITSISPRRARSSETGAAARAQAAFILPVNKLFRSFSRQRPRFLPLSAPSTATPAAKARFLFPFIFMVPFIYGLCFLLALTPFQKGREARGGEQQHLRFHPNAQHTTPKAAGLHPTSSLGPGLPAPTEAGPPQARREPALAKGWGEVGFGEGS